MQVRVDAVVALRSFIDAFDTEGLQQVKPLIPQLLDVFFQLMQEVTPLIHILHAQRHMRVDSHNYHHYDHCQMVSDTAVPVLD